MIILGKILQLLLQLLMDLNWSGEEALNCLGMGMIWVWWMSESGVLPTQKDWMEAVKSSTMKGQDFL